MPNERVSPACIIGLLLLKKEAVTFEEIRKIHGKICKAFPSLYVPIDREELYNHVVMTFPEMFTWGNSEVKRTEGSKKYFTQRYFDEFFSIFLPKKVYKFVKKELRIVA